MKQSQLLAVAAALAASLGACGENYDGDENRAYANDAYGNETGAAGYDETSAAGSTERSAGVTPDWPAGSRIVVEDDVTYRVLASGERVRLEEGDSRIVVEDGVRFRVDPDGTRFRIDDEGAVISVADDGIETDVRVGEDLSVEVNTTDQ